ncbi:reverse transcriptase domain-containing protein [Artemisia annua]|uniref:Reverse transcriptase domain-containing protein n=1 Tax=Artemisia annua TaxID=35608 RepID=A0A2U1M1D6_ARTAN|nr:reverse transcriptase domain-containing protein [Artemisia annua]
MPPRRSTRVNRGGAAQRGGRTGGRGGRGGGRGTGNNNNNNENPDFETIIAQQLQGLLPTIVTQVAEHRVTTRISTYPTYFLSNVYQYPLVETCLQEDRLELTEVVQPRGVEGLVEEEVEEVVAALVGDHMSNQGNNVSRNDHADNDGGNDHANDGNHANGNNGCTYREFSACKPVDFDGNGGAIAYTRWVEKMESVINISECADHQKIKYAACSLTGKALTWWNTQIQARGREAAIRMSWDDFKALLKEEYCPDNEMQKLEHEFYHHAMVGAGHTAYTDRFHELARLIPHMVTLESKRIERSMESDLKKKREIPLDIL